jgi:hypothetical protein
MSKSVHFFATKHDLESLLTAIESNRPLKYVQAGTFDSPETVVLSSGSQIPNLGLAPSGDHNFEPFWLATDRDAKVEVKVIPQRRGGIRYGIDPGLNPDSVVIWPGGVFGKSCVIAGQIGTGMINPASMELLNLFAREMRRQFKWIKSFLVGPEAEHLLDTGYRLTHSVKSPTECDLSRG